MSKQTPTYKLGYIVDGEITSQVTEERRMSTIDSQMRGLYEVLGNGVIEGWSVGRSGSGDLSVDVTAGKGVISLVVVENTDSTSITTLFPSSTNYIYASRSPTSYWDRSVSFSVTLAEIASPNIILLSKVVTSATGVTSIDNTVRSSVGLVASIESVVRNHRHVGGTDNPDPIDLATQVSGILSQENIPDLDGSKVKTGKVPKSVIPKIDHTSGLKNNGELTHAQLDSFVQNLSAFGKTVMGETALVNLLQLVLALKHQWPEIDEYLVNHLAFIPGISPDSIIDFDNTTAEVDTRTHAEGGSHKIYGSTGPGMRIFTKTWNSPDEFSEAEKDRTEADGDTLRLESEDMSVVLDDFDTIGNWETKIEDLSSSAGTVELDASMKVSGGYSAKVGIGTTETSNISFTMRKVFASQDWSQYDGIVFYINTKDIEHGDLFFFINDSTLGKQDSYTLVLSRNEPTINSDTLMNGWREIYVDLTKYQRTSINTIGFFMSTQYGWDAKRPFSLNVDKVTLTTGSRFVQNGGARFVYGNGFPQDFWRLRWDAVVPTGTSISFRTRVSNNLSDFDVNSTTPAPWSTIYSVSGFELPTAGESLYAYAQVEVMMVSSSDRKSSPVLIRLYLDRKASADDSSFVYEEQDQWESGERFNIDTTSDPGSIKIASMSDINNVFFGSSGTVEQTDSDLNSVYSGSGVSLPPSTRQAIAGEPPGFGQLSAVKRGDNDTLWVADTDNDRVLQVDKAGNIMFGLWGSNLTQPFDGYGTEESGPGSNEKYDSKPAANTNEQVPEALYAIYNPAIRKLSIFFSADLETVENDPGTTFRSDKMILKIGSKRVYFGSDTKFSLFGIDPAKYVMWAMSANKYIGQFTFASHILQTTLSQADSVALTSAVLMITPSLSISGINEQEIFNDDMSLSLVTPNVNIGSESVDNNGIRIRINSGTYSYHRTRSILLGSSDLSVGRNEIEAVIVDGNNNEFGNDEAACSLAIIFDPSDDMSSDPRISISSPSQGQTVTASPAVIEFESHNHPILPAGSCIEYSIDGGSWTEHRSYNAIEIADLTGGKHSVSIRLVDGSGNPLASEFANATVSFNFGVSADADVSLSVGAGAIRGITRTETTKTPDKTVAVHVANIHVVNMYCPVDIQVIPNESSPINLSGNPTVLVSKLRSPSTTLCLSSSQSTTPAAEEDIFASNYLDGHSVIQYAMDGQILLSNNAAQFADTRSNAKTYLGSANKASPSDILVADPIRHRAIIVRIDLATGKPHIIWEYTSDRLVSDFQIASDGTKEVAISDTACDNPILYARSGELVIWTNMTSIPIKIVSGTTTKAIFNADPDLTLYGDEFQSQELQPGEQYARHFDEGGDFDWFSYPNVVTGTVSISPAGVSQSDEYLVVEKDPVPSIGSGRVSRVNSWGNIVWTFGEGVLYDPKDIRRLTGDSVIIST